MHTIALVGGGPAALFMFKKLIADKHEGLEVYIFEKTDRLGQGFPYSSQGSSEEHITNVSDNEIPTIVTHVKEWVPTARREITDRFNLEDVEINEYKVFPRLLFGEYLANQFMLLQQQARGIKTHVFYNTTVVDIQDRGLEKGIRIFTDAGEQFSCDKVIICTGHSFPSTYEDTVEGWFDSPYPPQKLNTHINFPVAIAGASLTAIDAVRTLARANGHFNKRDDGTYAYCLNEDSTGFEIVLHSLHGFLPAVRFHLEDTHLTPVPLLTEEQVIAIKKTHHGFVPLDLVFQKHFMDVIQQQDPDEYEKIKGKTLEEVIDYYLQLREKLDAFVLLKAEYAEAEKSIKRRASVLWKETLGALSYALNYPAKHFAAEDMLRLKRVLMPLVSLVIAYVPQGSCRELMALHDAGVISLKDVTSSSHAEPVGKQGARYTYITEDGKKEERYFKMYIAAIGQAPIPFNHFPFESLRNDKVISSAYLFFNDDKCGESEMNAGNTLVRKTDSSKYTLQVAGIQVNDSFQVMDRFGVANERIYIMAVPLIAGLNPDYSGLDFCEVAAKRIGNALFN